MEEQDMTPYTNEDLKEDWEFKIVRSATREFHKPEVLAQLIEEEALSGWKMVEKFDDRRIRFKRTANASRRNGMLPPGIDPYRTQYGRLSDRRVLIALIFTLGLATLAALFAAILIYIK
jgi:hypothetical protein